MKKVKIEFCNDEERILAQEKAKKEAITRGIKVVEYPGSDKGYVEYRI